MLNGPRITLRHITRADLPRINDFNNDLEIELLGGGDPPIPQSLERLFADFEMDLSKGGRDGSRFAIDADGILIGHCALFNYNDTNRTCELGITIGDREYWGRGYGRETVRLLLDYAFRYRNIHRVFLTVHSRNERAIRSYRANGFVEEGRLRQHVWSDGAYLDLVLMGILVDEWQKLPPLAQMLEDELRR